MVDVLSGPNAHRSALAFSRVCRTRHEIDPLTFADAVLELTDDACRAIG